MIVVMFYVQIFIFTGKKDLVLRNHRASDAMALAAYYKIPLLVRKKLLKEKMEA